MKPNQADVVSKLREVLYAETEDPVAELRAMGETLVKIAGVLDGLTGAQARSVLKALAELEGFEL